MHFCFGWFSGGSRLGPAGSFVPSNTKQALSNLLQRRSGSVVQPPLIRGILPQQQLLQMKLLQQEQHQQRLLQQQAQARALQQVCPAPQPEEQHRGFASCWGCVPCLAYSDSSVATIPQILANQGQLPLNFIWCLSPFIFPMFQHSLSPSR